MNIRGMVYDTARVLFRAAVRLEGGRVDPRDRPLRDRVHRPAPRRVRRGDARGCAERRIPRAGLHPGRPLPGQRQEVRGRSVHRGRRRKQLAREAIAAGSTTSTSTRRRWSISRSRRSTSSSAQLRGRRRLSKTVSELRAGGRHHLRRRRDRRGRHGEHHGRRAARLHGRLQPRRCRAGIEGLSKISVQSGTTHGGVVLADGTIADVKLDLDTRQIAVEAVHVRTQLFDGAVLRPDLADLAAQGNIDALSSNPRTVSSFMRPS